MLALSELRAKAAEVACGLAGLGMRTGHEAPYLDLVAPGEPHWRAMSIGTMSGCALVAAGFWRAMGVEHRRLSASYTVGSAVSRLLQIGRERDALRYPEVCYPEHADSMIVDALPFPGDVVLVGEGGKEHVYVCVESGERGDSQVLFCLDGGQRDAAGHQLTKLREHAWSVGPMGEVWDMARDQAVGCSWSAQRRVKWWVDLAALLQAQEDPTYP